MHHVNNAPTCHLCECLTAGINRRNSRVVRQRDTKRLNHARHGGGGAHRHTATRRAAHARLSSDEIVNAHATSFDLFMVAPNDRARSNALTAIIAVQHRATGEHNRRNIA